MSDLVLFLDQVFQRVLVKSLRFLAHLFVGASQIIAKLALLLGQASCFIGLSLVRQTLWSISRIVDVPAS